MYLLRPRISRILKDDTVTLSRQHIVDPADHLRENIIR